MILSPLTLTIDSILNMRKMNTILCVLEVIKNYTNVLINLPNKGMGSCALDLALVIIHTIHILASKPLETISTNMFNNTPMVVKVWDLD